MSDNEETRASSQSRPSSKTSKKKKKSKKRVLMTDAERKGIAAEAMDPLIQSLQNLKNLLLRKHKTSLYANNVVETNICMQGIKRLEKGQREIYELEDAYVDAVAEGKENEAEALRTEMVDIKAAAIHASHLDLVVDQTEARGLGLENYRDRMSPPFGRRVNHLQPRQPSRSPSPSRGRSRSEQPYRGSTASKQTERGRTPTGERRSRNDRRPEDDYDTREDPYYFRRKNEERNREYDDNNEPERFNFNPPPRMPQQSQQRQRSAQPSEFAASGQQPEDQSWTQKRAEDITCPMCNELNGEYQNKTRLNKHLAQRCPYMIGCEYCNRVIEVRTLNEHYLSKCPFLDNKMKQCTGCGQAIEERLLERHLEKYCKELPPPENFIWCLLCDQVVQDSEQAWRRHLMSEPICKGNQMREVGGAGSPQDMRKDLARLPQNPQFAAKRAQNPDAAADALLRGDGGDRTQVRDDGVDILQQEFKMPHTIEY